MITISTRSAMLHIPYGNVLHPLRICKMELDQCHHQTTIAEEHREHLHSKSHAAFNKIEFCNIQRDN